MKVSACIYVLAVLLANLTATLFIPLGWGEAQVLVAVGTLVFGVTFTQRDRLHRHGRRVVYTVIVLAAVLNLGQMLLLARFESAGLTIGLGLGHDLAAWLEGHGQTWLAQGFGDLAGSGLRVFIASFLAIVIAEAADTEVFARARQRTWLGRVITSNAVSIPLDSLLFNLIAFAGVFPWPTLGAIILGEIFFKSVTATVYALCWPQKGRLDPLPASAPVEAPAPDRPGGPN